jgi:hypothetical protein
MTLSAGLTGMDFGFAEPTAIRQRQSRGGRHWHRFVIDAAQAIELRSLEHDRF